MGNSKRLSRKAKSASLLLFVNEKTTKTQSEYVQEFQTISAAPFLPLREVDRGAGGSQVGVKEPQTTLHPPYVPPIKRGRFSFEQLLKD
ncbi:MAG TPA: hypothetical protein ACFYEK_10510 [Candidatus Wunengus sp. YC60]|uniref:hypothetical protein n=1 Tax=Candidatus Wunengus sp. YC60 TaxID=3367697 RepID=UPI004026572D